MKSYVEEQCDLFKEYGDRDDVYFAHYISADGIMVESITIQFVDWFKKKYDLSLRSLTLQLQRYEQKNLYRDRQVI